MNCLFPYWPTGDCRSVSAGIYEYDRHILGSFLFSLRHNLGSFVFCHCHILGPFIFCHRHILGSFMFCHRHAMAFRVLPSSYSSVFRVLPSSYLRVCRVLPRHILGFVLSLFYSRVFCVFGFILVSVVYSRKSEPTALISASVILMMSYLSTIHVSFISYI